MLKTLFDRSAAESDIRLTDLSAGSPCSLIAVNLQNPGADRAKEILDYLSHGLHDVIVLTELTDKPSVRLLIEGLSALGYCTTPLGQSAPKEYHTLIASRLAFDTLPVTTESLRNRVKIIRLKVSPTGTFLYVVGVYGYSFNPNNRTKRRHFKTDFESRVLRRLQGHAKQVIVLGDLNIIESQFHDHFPEFWKEDKLHYERFGEAGYVDIVRRTFPAEPQYTWYPPTGGAGQRLDHVFVARSLLPSVGNLAILHELRQKKLTDHSGVALKLTVPS